MAVGVSFEDLLRYEDEQLENWRKFFLKRPHLLQLEATPKENVAGLLFHIFVAEYHSAQRLLGETMTSKSEFKQTTIDELFSIAAQAHVKMLLFLARADSISIGELRKFPSQTLGEITATPKKLLLHALIHSIRHWAQIARVLRENGQRADFSHDVLFSKVLD